MPAELPSLVVLAQHVGTHALPAFIGLITVAMLASGGICAARQRHLIQHGPNVHTQAPRIVVGLAAGFGGIVAAASVFAWIASRIAPDRTLGLADQALADAIGAHVPRPALHFFSVVTHVGDPSVLFALAAIVTVLLWRLDRRALMLGWLLALAGNALLNPWLKQIFERVRPLHDHGFALATGFSFPSGHSSGAMVTYGMLGYLALRLLSPRWHVGVVMTTVAIVLAIACSRIFLQVHFASDVAAGLLSGGTWLAVCIASLEYARRRALATDTTR
ncbi:MAG: phosphatase PAP2 family protein [Janthinobacterium lividum]